MRLKTEKARAVRPMGTCLLVMGCLLAGRLAAVAAGDPFAGAKWIGGNAVTLPDYDFGAAQWIAPKDGNGGGKAVFERRFTLAARGGRVGGGRVEEGAT